MKNCIFMISSRKLILETCIKLLYKNFNNKYNYPVLIFYMDDIYDDLSFQEKIKKYGNIEFINITYKVPEHIKEEELFYNRQDIPYVKRCFPKSRIGYLHAINWKINFFKESIFENFENFIMMDDDSFLIDKIDIDFFKEMENEKFIFGTSHTDDSVNKNINNVRLNLHDFIKKFLEKYNYDIKNNLIKEMILNDNTEYLYGNKFRKTIIKWCSGNFNLISRKFIQDEKWINWVNEIYNFGGSYKYRWGDVEMMSLYCYLFLDNPIFDFKLIEKGLYETGNTDWLRVGTAPSTKN